MNVFIIIALFCIVGLSWRWLNKKPDLKGSPSRTRLASRGKTGAKPKLT